MFCAALFCKYGDFQNSKQRAEEKPHHKATKLKLKFYFFFSGSEQPSPGATPLSWPKSIYYHTMSSFSSNTKQLLQVGNSHLKHLYLLFMKQEQHISITL